VVNLNAPVSDAPGLGMGDHIFVCYAREDLEFVLKLSSNLKSRGARVWVDKWDIPSGADWDQSIDRAIMDCARFLIVLSPDAEKSREVGGELRMALDKDKTIVPLLYKTCEIPRQLRTIQHINCGPRSADSELLLEEILKALGVMPAPGGLQSASLLARGASKPAPFDIVTAAPGKITRETIDLMTPPDWGRLREIVKSSTPLEPDPVSLNVPAKPESGVPENLEELRRNISPTEMVVCPQCNKHVENRYLRQHYDQKHPSSTRRLRLSSLRKVSAGPTALERAAIEAEAGTVDAEHIVRCPVCHADVKRKNLLAHWKNHWSK